MNRFLKKLRFLPLTIFGAALLLTFKVGDIMNGFDAIVNGSISVADAQAQDKPATIPAVKPAVPTEDTEEEGEEEEDAADDEDEEEEAERPSVTDDPTLLTLQEIDLLQQLSERRAKLDALEREMEVRAGLLSAAEDRINKKVEELKVLQTTIERLLKTHEDQQNAKMASLVKIYENMKPKDAARIFETMELDTLLRVAEGMKERKLAPVMAQMNPEKAREMTAELMRQRAMPRAGSAVGG